MSKLLLPLLGLGLTWYLTTVRLKLSLKADLWLVKPPWLGLLGWITLWLGWMVGTNWIMQWRGPWDFEPWHRQPVWVSVVRVVSVCLVGPVLEEVLFRGLFFIKLQRWGLSSILTTVILSGIWAGIHVDYSWSVIGLLFFNGMILTLSLIQTRSLMVPIVLHMVWNLYAIW